MSLYPQNSIIHAPLSGFTDMPYRNSMHRFGCRYAFAEMVDAAALVHGRKTRRFLDRSDLDEWLGVQFVGSDVSTLIEATKIVNDVALDVIDFNLGCPAAKVAKKCGGAELCGRSDEAIRSFEAIVTHSRFPVSAKMRILNDSDVQPTIDFCQQLVNAGAQTITIHGRIKEKVYSGPVFFDILSAVREAVDIPIVANGGISDFATYNEMRSKTGCDSVMVARGAMGNPWLFKAIHEQKKYIPPTPVEVAEELERHLFEMIDYYGETLALKIGRKVILDYLRGRGYGGAMKARVSNLCTSNDLVYFVDDLKKGPASSYWTWLEKNPQDARRMLNI